MSAGGNAVITEDLVSRATAGDTDAIADLLRLAQTDIRRYARRSCRNPSDAEEAAQEALTSCGARGLA